jgi:hypothetical protein
VTPDEVVYLQLATHVLECTSSCAKVQIVYELSNVEGAIAAQPTATGYTPQFAESSFSVADLTMRCSTSTPLRVFPITQTDHNEIISQCLETVLQISRTHVASSGAHVICT